MIQVIPNQAISIWTDEDFNTKNYNCTQDNRTFCQIVYPTDSTQFQVRQTELTGDELIINGDFSDGLNDWDYVPGVWVSFSNLGAQLVGLAGSISQVVSLESGKTYKISMTVLSNQNAQICFEIISLVGSVNTYGDVCTAEEVLFGDTLTLTTYFRVSDTGDVVIQLHGTQEADSSELIITGVTMVELSEPEITIQTCDGTHVADVTDIEYFEDIASISIDWTDLEDGCYRICVGGMEDTANNILGDALCLGTESGRAMTQENGYCIKWFG